MFSLSLAGTDGDFAVLNFTVREWSYAAPGQADFYGCTVPDGEAVGRGPWGTALGSGSEI